MKKTHLYKRSEGKDFIFSSEKEWPNKYYNEHGEYWPSETRPDGGFHKAVSEWLSTAEKVQVYPGEVEKFMLFITTTNVYWTKENKDKFICEGIIIQECFYTEAVISGVERPGKYAFFRSQEPDKPQENTESQEELWNEVVSIINRDVGDQWNYDCMGQLNAKFEIKRRTV